MKPILIFLCILLFLFFAASCGDEGSSPGSDTSDQDEDDDDPGDDDDNNEPSGDDDDFAYPFCDIDRERFEQIFFSMTLREKIAQLYAVGVQTTPWFDVGDARRFIEDVGVGAVFIQPVTGAGFWTEWTVKNMNKLQGWAMARENPIPLLIACDQEGGIPQTVSNLNGGTDTPGNMGLGATFSPLATYDSYFLMGAQLSAMGINNPYSPVAELMVNENEASMYTRCFGENTDDVAAYTKQAVRGFQENLVVATAKHFPSHSTAEGDEHTGLVVNNESEETVRERYFPPFEAAIEAGVDMIMLTHARYAAWEDEFPTTFSRTLVTDILRGELGFEALIITDDMNMGSITNTPWDEHPHVLALAAGADMIIDVGGDNEMMFGTHPDNEQWAIDVEGQIDAIVEAIDDGRLDEKQIDGSVRRILETKMKYCLFERPYRDVEQAIREVDTPDQVAKARCLHEQALTLVRNDDGLFPLDPEGGQKIHVVSIFMGQSVMYPDAYWGNLSGTSLMREVKKLYPAATGDVFDVEPPDWYINAIVNNAANADPDLIIIGTYHAYYHTQQQKLVDGLLDLNVPTIVVALALPYDLLAFPEVTTYLATYSNRTLAIETAAHALFGLAAPKGRLPVALPGLHEYGWSAN